MAKYKQIYSVATGIINPFLEESRMAVDFMSNCKGFTALHNVEEGYTLWLYDSYENAKRAKNLAQSQGISCGMNIGRFKWDGGEELIEDMDKNYIEKHTRK